jgi:nicotinate-nucleotide adenylyltransferase
MEVALIGGSFNPPHVGHLLLAHFVRATQPVDEVWLMPSFHHPFGKALAPFEARLAMCEALCADATGWLKVVDVERELGGEGRTVDTLEHLTRTRPGATFTLVIGSDIVAELPKWKRVDRIRELARVLVVHRAGHPDPAAFGPPLAEISSTAIREALRTGGDVRGVVPRSVLAYVHAHGLYGPEAGRTG